MLAPDLGPIWVRWSDSDARQADLGSLVMGPEGTTAALVLHKVRRDPSAVRRDPCAVTPAIHPLCAVTRAP